jgi:protoporphyrinogen/coproporphyrinogen III oxidase
MLFKSRPRRKDIPRSYTLAGGLQSVVDAVAQDSKVSLRTDSEVVAIEKTAGGLSVRLATGDRLEAPGVAVAVSPPAAAALLAPHFRDAAEALARIRASSVQTVGVVLPNDATPLEPVAGVIPLGGRYFSMVSRDTVPDPNWRAFAFHFKPGIAKDDALQDICALLRVDRSKIQALFERNISLASPAMGHRRIVEDLDHDIAGTPLLVTGNYFGGLAIEDCVIRSRAEVARFQLGYRRG